MPGKFTDAVVGDLYVTRREGRRPWDVLEVIKGSEVMQVPGGV